MRFKLKVFSESSGVTAVEYEAISIDEAHGLARAQGYLVMAAAEERQHEAGFAPFGSRRSRRFSLLLFSQHLLALLEAGLNLTEAIETLIESESARESQTVLNRLLEKLRGGESCSGAMSEMPESFPEFFVAAVRASERGGNLAESLRRYVEYQTQIESVRKKTISAMIYPVLLFIVGGLVTMFLLGYVVPKFSRIYEDRSTDLPFLSKLLMQWGKLAEHYGWLLLGGSFLLLGLVVWAATQPKVRAWVGLKLWSLPGLGERMRIYQLARLYRTLAMLLRGGTPITSALSLVHGLLSPVLRSGLNSASQRIREGQAISTAFEACGLTTPVAYRMLRVGERSGRMGEMMERVALFFDDEIARWVDVFTKTFEPIMMALIGVMVGGIVILMYLPIFELAGSLK